MNFSAPIHPMPNSIRIIFLAILVKRNLHTKPIIVVQLLVKANNNKKCSKQWIKRIRRCDRWLNFSLLPVLLSYSLFSLLSSLHLREKRKKSLNTRLFPSFIRLKSIKNELFTQVMHLLSHKMKSKISHCNGSGDMIIKQHKLWVTWN